MAVAGTEMKDYLIISVYSARIVEVTVSRIEKIIVKLYREVIIKSTSIILYSRIAHKFKQIKLEGIKLLDC